MTTTIDFDTRSPGDVVTSESGATFDEGPTVFDPQRVPTHTEPYALRAPAPCVRTIGDRCSRQIVRFNSPKSSVSLRVGLDDQPATELPVSAQLKAFDAGGAKVADSGQVPLGDSGYKPITTLVQVISASTDIVHVELLVGDTDLYNDARRVNMDTLTFTDDAPPPLPPAPTVSLTEPAEGALFVDASQVRASGRVDAPSGVARFCVTANVDRIPPSCAGAAALAPDGRFERVVVEGDLRPADNTITAWVEDRNARATSSSVRIRLAETDVRPSNIEVIQAVQTDLPAVVPAAFEGPHSARYNGVPLVAGKTTLVRVWAEARFDRQLPTIDRPRMLLAGSRGGVSLGAPLSPLSGPATLTAAGSVPSAVTPAQRADPTLSWTFVLPEGWRSGEIALEAIANPTGFPGVISECGGCDANNRLRLDGVRFTPTRSLTITPIELVWRDRSGALQRPLREDQAFAAAITASPFALNVRPYQTQVDITDVQNRPAFNDGRGNDADEKNGAAFDEVAEWASSAPGWQRQGVIVGVNTGVARGLASGVAFCCDLPRVDQVAVAESARPLTSVAHEAYHHLGFSHAGYGCPNAGGPLGVHGETWPVDDRGTLQSTGYDVRPLLSRAGPLKVYGLQSPNGMPATNFDFMSYCANANGDPDSWISARNWTRAVERFRAGSVRTQADPQPGPAAAAPSARPPRARGPRTRALRVLAVVAGGAELLRSEPLTSRTSVSERGGDARITVRDGDGDVVSSTRVRSLVRHANRGGDVRIISATVPARAAASIEVRRRGQLLGRARRPRGRLRVIVAAPRRGTRISARGAARLRWRVAGSRRGLRTTILFSPDGRRRWRPVAAGVRGTRWDVPVELLQRASRARFRVRVTNGWTTASARSGPVRIAAAAPRARIVEPAGALRALPDATLSLRGEGYADDGVRLPDRALTWYARGKRLGRGRVLRVDGLPRGTRRLRLVARTSDGRYGSATVAVKIIERARR